MIQNELIATLYVDHIVLTVSDVVKTKNFYSKIFGKPDSEDDYSLMYRFGETKLFFVLPHGNMPQGDRFNPNRIGLEHFAIGVRTLDDLKKIEEALSKNVIENSGIHIDKHSKKEKIWLNDIDGIRLEFFIKPDKC